ncbi:MAG: LacI family transcriptional regulator [Treponema sp.]|nr:LacI family transcriptional regulator [Treponema sp.]
MVTIYDISKKTGFSPPTVSKALNGAGTLSLVTRGRILDAARDMGYVPNLTARALSTRRSRLIGIINKDIYLTDVFIPPIFNNILGGARQVMEAQGYELLMLRGAHDFLTAASYRNIDGFLLFAIPGEEEYRSLLKSRLPCVSTNDLLPGISTAITDNYGGAVTAVQYLVDLGHRHIAYIAGPVTWMSPASEERFQGYRDCLERNGITENPKLTETAGLWSALGGYEAARRLLEKKESFTAIFATSDNLAYGTIKALNEAGIRVPQDVSIVGFDGDPLGEYVSPPLTTMRQDSVLIGKTAAELLLKRLSGEERAELKRIPAELVLRSSCRPPCKFS